MQLFKRINSISPPIYKGQVEVQGGLPHRQNDYRLSTATKNEISYPQFIQIYSENAFWNETPTPSIKRFVFIFLP